MDFVFLLIYILLFFFFLLYYLKWKKNFDAGAVVVSLYLVYAVFGMLLFYDKNSMENIDFQYFSIKIFPLLYLFVCLIISFSPILLFKSKSYKGIEPPAFNLDLFACFFILCFVLQIGKIFSHLSSGLYLVLFVDDGTTELYGQMSDNASEGGKGISNILSIFANMLYGFGVLMFYYYLTLNKKKKWIIWGLGIGILIGIFEYAASGQRGGMIKRSLVLISTYFLFKDYLNVKTNKIIKMVGLSIVSFMAVVFMAMSISRFGEREGGVVSSINRYAGQAVLNFDRYAFDNNGIRYGDRVFPVFKKILQFSNVPDNYIERRAKYPYLHINDEVFVTFVGDFCFDFGPIIAFLIILLFTIWVRSKTKSNRTFYPFHKLILLQFCMNIIIQGGSLFPYADTGNLIMITYFLLYVFFLLAYSNRRYATTQNV